MSEIFDEIPTYLPKYLSAPETTDLFSELSQFPNNIDSRMYTSFLEGQSTIYQGDGLSDIWIAELPKGEIRRARVIVLSNTCDISPNNLRKLGARLLYCPIVRFSSYQSMLSEQNETSTRSHLADIRKQRISSMFYLPESQKLGEESIALLDRPNNCALSGINLESVIQSRLFTLSMYGWYLFLFKLSIHLSRNGLAKMLDNLQIRSEN